MKLELKHIVGYLPYELMLKDTKRQIALTTTGAYFNANKDESFKFMLLNGWGIIDSEECKPILRPMSDITKDIEFITEDYNFNHKIYPEKISLMDYLNIAKRNPHKYRPRLNRFEYSLGNGTVSYNFDVNGQLLMPYDIVKLFYMNKFDIFNLIKNNLAIDINTL
jgi:hypothetical protein